VLLHDSPLLKRQRAGLLQQTGRQTNLSNVMDKASKVRGVLLYF
jgi:hypothetical protein